MPRTYRTTAEHFATFEAECRRLVALWGVNDWDVTFQHSKLDEDDLGAAYLDATARSAIIALATKWPHKVTDEALIDTAREEVCHVAMGEITALAFDRHASEERCVGAVEAAVKRLKNLLPR